MSTEEGRWLEGLDERTERDRREAAEASAAGSEGEQCCLRLPDGESCQHGLALGTVDLPDGPEYHTPPSKPLPIPPVTVPSGHRYHVVDGLGGQWLCETTVEFPEPSPIGLVDDLLADAASEPALDLDLPLDAATGVTVPSDDALARLEARWSDALDHGCPSCGPVDDCDHIEGYHYALSDVRALSSDRLDSREPNGGEGR